jgi:uncharacterized lipoprotein YbaY
MTDAVPLVTGRIVVTRGNPSMADASVHISLDDVSRADGAAISVAETVIHHVRHDPGETVLPFALSAAPDAPSIDPHCHYAVRVWVDSDGDGRPGPGDLYSDRRYPVLTRGHGSTVMITLGRAEGR